MKLVKYIFYIIPFISICAKSDFAVIGCHDQAYHRIGQYADRNKQAYCKKHNYDLFLYHESFDTSRHPAWSKILAILKHINDYKWLLWIDSDALIMNENIKIESLIDNRYDFIVSIENVYLCNTGVFLIKGGAWGKAFLENVYAQTQFVKTKCCWEQDAVNYLYKKDRQTAKRFKFLPPRLLNAHPDILKNRRGERLKYMQGDFIIHFFGRNNKEELMKEYYKKSIGN